MYAYPCDVMSAVVFHALTYFWVSVAAVLFPALPRLLHSSRLSECDDFSLTLEIRQQFKAFFLQD